jgi:hypothetical protein
LYYYRQKGGECIDPWAPNFDWKYWNFDFCYLPSFVNCYARPGRKCYCCGWSKCKYGAVICIIYVFVIVFLRKRDTECVAGGVVDGETILPQDIVKE